MAPRGRADGVEIDSRRGPAARIAADVELGERSMHRRCDEL